MITIWEWSPKQPVVLGQKVHVYDGAFPGDIRLLLGAGRIRALLDHKEGPEVLVSFFHPKTFKRVEVWVGPTWTDE
jgi:hypothetical protein